MNKKKKVVKKIQYEHKCNICEVGFNTNKFISKRPGEIIHCTICDECSHLFNACLINTKKKENMKLKEQAEYIYGFGKNDNGLQWYKKARDKIVNVFLQRFNILEKEKERIRKLEEETLKLKERNLRIKKDIDKM